MSYVPSLIWIYVEIQHLSEMKIHVAFIISILKMTFVMKVKQIRWYFLSYDFNSLLDLQNVSNNVCHIINVFVLQIDLFWVQFQFFLTAWDMKITLLLGYFNSHIDFRRKVWCLSFNLFIFYGLIIVICYHYGVNIWLHIKHLIIITIQVVEFSTR